MKISNVTSALAISALLCTFTMTPFAKVYSKSKNHKFASFKKEETKDVTKLKNYKVFWKNEQVTVLLPESLEYSKGWVKTSNGGYQDLVSAKDGIKAPHSGSVLITYVFVTAKKTKNNETSYRSQSMARLTLEKMPKNISSEEFLNRVKKDYLADGNKILFQDTSSVIFSESKYNCETYRKVMINKTHQAELEVDCYNFHNDNKFATERPIFQSLKKVLLK